MLNNPPEMIKQKVKIAAGLLLLIAMSSCVHLKEYQKSRLNDSEMALTNRKVEKNELNFQSYEEAASGANAGKTGGGCGCN
jgi:hypothetical protein